MERPALSTLEDPTSHRAVRVLVRGLPWLGILTLLAATDVAGLATVWTRALLTFAALVSFVAGILATPPATGRIRLVRARRSCSTSPCLPSGGSGAHTRS